jgi:hypothetical protein
MPSPGNSQHRTPALGAVAVEDGDVDQVRSLPDGKGGPGQTDLHRAPRSACGATFIERASKWDVTASESRACWSLMTVGAATRAFGRATALAGGNASVAVRAVRTAMLRLVVLGRDMETQCSDAG